jgi:hypothetical protein
MFYDGIKKSDWPVLEKVIIDSITEKKEITNPLILKHFDLRKK